MTGIDSYSTTPATNATATGGSVNWAEGQAPSTVNNTSRQMLADLRSYVNDLVWFQYGTGDQGAGNIAVPAVYASATSFTITGADVTVPYHVGRRVRAVGSATGTIYGTISATSYNGGNTTTTVTVRWDSGSLSNETLVISLSQIPVTGTPAPVSNVFAAAGGTADALTAAFTPITTSLTDGLQHYVRAASANATTTPTYAPDSLPAHTITKFGGAALIAGDIQAGHELILRYRLSATRWELLNPFPNYVEGTWTPVDNSGASLSLTINRAIYRRIGNLVTIQASITYPSTVSGANASLSGLPFAVPANGGATAYIATSSSFAVANSGASTIAIVQASGNAQSNSSISTGTLIFSLTYSVT